MPNRLIKESICTSEDIDSLSPQEEVFFYRLIVNCDDFGRMDARPPILKAKLFPLKSAMKAADIEKHLRKLAGVKPIPLIYLYIINGVRYLQMAKWDQHQQIRAKRSKYPAMDITCKHLISDDITCNQMISDDSICTRNPIQSNPNPNPNPIQLEEDEEEAIPLSIRDPAFAEIVTAYTAMNHQHEPQGTQFDQLVTWYKEVEPGVVVMAIAETVDHDAHSMAYLKKVMNDWIYNGLKTVEAVKQMQIEKADKERRGGNKGEPISETGRYSEQF